MASARPSTIAGPCEFKPTAGDLPTWARAGFTSRSGQTFVTSAGGDMVGVLFGYPMREPRAAGDGKNKVLWVSRIPQTTGLTIEAHLVGSTQDVDLGAVPLGPSYVDVPHAGCWRLDLRWSGRVDTVDIRYDQG
ncbi:MAG TPA: hypothetical protein VGF84_05760 [Micromonosporaceae bacterium]